jgi:hypothetical protein
MRRQLPFIISPTTSSRFTVHFACPQLWPLASRIGSGKFRIWLPSGNPTSSGGQKERHKNGVCDTKARSNKCKMNGQMSVEAVSS